MNKFLLFILLLIIALHAHTQGERSFVRQGNKKYDKNLFLDSEIKYKDALEKNSASNEANFNLGDAFYKQKKYEQAAQQFELTAGKTSDKKTRAMAFHNLGNSYLQMFKNDSSSERKLQNLDKSINAYKNALRIKPDDLDTKYNLSYALKLKQQFMQNQKNGKKQDQNKKQDKKDNKEQNKNQEKQQNQQNQNKQEQKQELSKQEAEQLLKALQNEEKKTQDKVLKKQERPVRVKIEKDW